MLSVYFTKGWRRKGLLLLSVFIYLGLVYLAVGWNKLFTTKPKTEIVLQSFQRKYSLPKLNAANRKEIVIKDTQSKSQTSHTTKDMSVSEILTRVYKYFTNDFPITEEPVLSWIKNEKVFCDKRLLISGDRFAIGKNVRMFPSIRANIQSVAKGGEEVRFVLNQDLSKEEYIYNMDFWEMDCPKENTPINSNGFYWSRNIVLKTESNNSKAENQSVPRTETMYTIGVRRQDYANLHNWVRDVFNVFIVMLHFKLQTSQVSILFLDGHPFTYLDHAWENIYSKPIRIGHLTEPVNYEKFIWGIQENMGPITEPSAQNTVPYLEEFRSFVLSQFNLSSEHKLQCSKPKITLILRRNAVYHPRNVEGKVGRKIFNEPEIVDALMKKVPKAHIETILMESVPMVTQLKISSNTDIWIGMHGAGMSHTIFLPKHAGVLELFAKDFKSGRPWFKCFHDITNWRNMSYQTWENLDSALDMPHDFTIVPTEILTSKVEALMNKLCPK